MNDSEEGKSNGTEQPVRKPAQQLENLDTPARERGLLLELVAYKTELEKEVLGYEGR